MKEKVQEYDYIIIGSGFGGSVSALRLAEKGYKVLVIEKGKWYREGEFAKSNWNLRKWLWMPLLRCFGIMKISIFRHMNILSGVGVGGGSLVYANTLPIPNEAFYNTGSWAKLADWKLELSEHYQSALKMLGTATNPKLYDADWALQKLADKIGRKNYFESTNVAVCFGEADVEIPDPYFNGKGPDRKGCNFCGGCMTGCNYNAKNTLDKNYLYLAQQLGVTILAENKVVDVMPIGTGGSQGYEITCQSATKLWSKRKKFSTSGLVFSGGVLGTVALMLKLKETSLPELSDRVGFDIRTNNETLISVTNLDGKMDMSKGVAIGSILHTDENSHLEVVRYNENSGFWRLLHWPFSPGNNLLLRLWKILGSWIRKPLRMLRLSFVKRWGRSTIVLLFMQTIDSTLRFKRGLLGRMTTGMTAGPRPTPNIPESVKLTREYARLVNGEPTNFVMETLAGLASTAHILGGAVMGEDKETGVIDSENKVFGYKNMFVIDGSMISANPGVNPSLSITAIAERAMSKIEAKNEE